MDNELEMVELVRVECLDCGYEYDCLESELEVACPCPSCGYDGEGSFGG